jgi:hypothetical protein
MSRRPHGQEPLSSVRALMVRDCVRRAMNESYVAAIIFGEDVAAGIETYATER